MKTKVSLKRAVERIRQAQEKLKKELEEIKKRKEQESVPSSSQN